MFSKESRWDRHTPEQDRDDQPISVGVIFRDGKVFPKFFHWNKRKYTVKEVTYHWTEDRGSDVLHYYSVTDGTNLYQIYLNTKRLVWRMAKVCPLE